MPNLQLTGVYANWNGGDWNPGTNGNWYAGRLDFASKTGITPSSKLNTGLIYLTYDVMGNWPAVLDGQLNAANLYYTNPPYDYIPAVSFHMYDSTDAGTRSPATGNTYGWNDTQAYADIAAGRWDAVWSGIVDKLKANNRTVAFIRAGYEDNGTFMPDFPGYDNASIDIWAQCKRRIFTVMKARAATQGVSLIMGYNPQVQAFNPFAIEALYQAIGTDVQNCCMLDAYDFQWGLPDNQVQTNGAPQPSQATMFDLWSWQTDHNIPQPSGWGYGYKHFVDIAKRYYLGTSLMETGVIATAPVFSWSHVDHAWTTPDPFFFTWLAGAINDGRSQGVKMLGAEFWSIDAGSLQDPALNICRADFAANLSSLIGDSFDPALLPWGSMGRVPYDGTTHTNTSTVPAGVVLTPFLAVNTPNAVQPNTVFTVTATISNSSANLSAFTYKDDGGVAHAMPSGATLSAGTLTFTHPGMAAGSHVISIVDSTDTLTASTNSFLVQTVVESPNGTYITSVGPQIVDANGTVYTMAGTGGNYQVAINGVIAQQTNQVIAQYYINHTWYQKNSSGDFYNLTGYVATDPTIGVTLILNSTIPGSGGSSSPVTPSPAPVPVPTPAPPVPNGGGTTPNKITVNKPLLLMVGTRTITGKETDPSKPVYLAWHNPNDASFKSSAPDVVKATVAKDGTFSAKVLIDHPGVVGALYASSGGSMVQMWTARPMASVAVKPAPRKK